MAEIKEFVINDRRKFTPEGDIRPDAPPSQPRPPRPETLLPPEDSDSARLVEHKGPQAVPKQPQAEVPAATGDIEDQLPPPPTAEQTDQARRAFNATVDRLDTAIRASNPGADRPPELTFAAITQSLYMQALMQLGDAPGPGQQPHMDILGARQTIDMLGILSTKTKGNLSDAESRLLDTALFELHMAFLEVTQALARQSASRQPGAPATPGVPPTSGPSIVR